MNNFGKANNHYIQYLIRDIIYHYFPFLCKKSPRTSHFFINFLTSVNLYPIFHKKIIFVLLIDK